jgi:hypothetical protein
MKTVENISIQNGRVLLKAGLVKVEGNVKGKGPQSCQSSRFPHFLYTRLTDGGEVVRLKLRLAFTPRIFLILIAVKG